MNSQKNYAEIHANCPTCQQSGLFIYAGEQRVPKAVAEKLGFASDCIDLWHCSNCNSTISQLEIEKVNG